VNELLIGLLGAVLATNQPQAVSNLVQQQTGVSVAIENPNDQAEKELQQLMADDDAAQAEVDKWIRDDANFYKQGAGETKADLRKRILDRFAPVRKGYEDFLKKYPDSAHGYLAYGSFLNDIGDEDGAAAQYEKSRQLDPKNPAVWNNLANYYGEFGPVTNAFAYYAKAIELNPNEPVYYENFATTVYLFRKDAREYFGINEAQVFDKSLALYKKAIKLDPSNFPLATDYAQSYYGIKPLRTNDALVAWTNTLAIARNEAEREGIYIHLARIKIMIGQFDQARAQLAGVTNEAYTDIKNRLERNLVQRENAATNSTVAGVSTNVPAFPTNKLAASNNAAMVLTNQPSAPTNQLPLLTNAMPALTNPPPFSTNIVTALTNIPPIPQKASDLEMSPTNSP
jgi:tetratricopeptide (TPR) repeat protein